MTREEIILALGVDASSVGKELRAVNSQVAAVSKDSSADMTRSFHKEFFQGGNNFSSMGKKAGKEFGTGFSRDAMDTITKAGLILYGANMIKGVVADSLKLGDFVAEGSAASGMGTEDFQRITAGLLGVGVSAEKSNSFLERFSTTLGKAQAGEKEALKKFSDIGVSVRDGNGRLKEGITVLGDFAEALKGMNSRAIQNSAAADILGKGSQKIVSALKEGREAVRNLGKDAIILTGTETDILDATGDKLELGWKNIKAVVAKGAAGYANAVGNALKGKNPFNADVVDEVAAKRRKEAAEKEADLDADQAQFLANEKKKLEDAEAARKAELKKKTDPLDAEAAKLQERLSEKKSSLADREYASASRLYILQREMEKLNKNSVEYKTKFVELLKEQGKHDEISAKIKDEADRKDKTDRQKKLREEIADQKKAQQSLIREQMDQFAPTIDELANSGRWVKRNFGSGKVWRESPGAQSARNIQALEADAKDARVFGNFDRSRNLIGQANFLRDRLTDQGFLAGGDKNRELMQESATSLSELLMLAKQEGIKLKED